VNLASNYTEGTTSAPWICLLEMGVDIISSSYNTAKSLDMGGISDGTRLEIVHYCDSCFEVAVFIDAFRIRTTHFPLFLSNKPL
jgi:hypothetical protein